MLLTITDGSKADAKVSAYHYISIPLQVHTDLLAYVDHYDTEVSGCGMVERIEHRFKSKDVDEADTVEIEFAIREIYLPNKQDNSASSTEIDDDTIADLMANLIKQNKNTEHLRLHWHSHADMDTFHSGTDEDNYATLSNGDFLVSLVVNKAHRVLGRVDYFKPVRVTLNNLGVHLVLDKELKVSKDAEKSIEELDKHVKTHLSTYNYPNDNKNVSWKRLSGIDDYDDEMSGYDARDLADYKMDMDIAHQMGIKKKDAIFYRQCKQMACLHCKEVDKCQEYLLAINKLDYTY